MKILDVPQSGSLAGNTSSRNRYGQYRRTRAIPVNPNTAYQQAVRAGLTTLAAAWRGLTAAVQAQWLAWAESHPKTDSLGQSYTLTGFQQYLGTNQLRITAGEATSSSVPSNDAPAAPVAGAVTATTATLTVAFTPDPVPTGQILLIRASGPVSAGVSFPPSLKYIGQVAAAGVSPADIFTAYVARWGTPIAGRKIIVDISLYEDGVEGGRSRSSGIVS